MKNRQEIFSVSYQQPMVTLADLLADYDDGKGNKTPKYFRIPIYQRGYAWGVRQCYELWEDIKRIKEKKVSSHFVGTLSLNLDGNNDGKSINNGRVYDIVDGQQRFTTLMIILRLLLNKVNSPFVSDYIGVSRYARKFQYTYSNSEARDYFEGRLYSLDENFPHNDNAYFVNIENAIKYYGENLSYDRKFNLFDNKPKFPKWYYGCDIKGSMSVQDAQEYLDIVLNQLVFSINFVSAKYNVNTVFESMNNRGKDPTRLEVLKNRLMYLAPVQYIRDNIDKTWGKIYASLGLKSYAVLSDDEFLKCHWFMFNGGIVKQNKDEHINQVFDNAFSLGKINSPTIQQEIENYVNSLDKSISIWRYLNIPDAGTQSVSTNLVSGNIATLIGKLSRLIGVNGQSFIKSFILAVLCADKLPQATLEKLLDIVEKYIFIIGYLKRDKNAFSSSWATLAHEIYDLNSNADISGIMAKATDIINEKEKEIRANLNFALDEFYKIKSEKLGYYGWSGRWYFLFEYDLHVTAVRTQTGANAIKWYSWNTIEHILPESPYKSDYWTKAFDQYINNPDAMHVFMHSLGNFLPLDGKNNASLGNSDYHTKCNGNGNPNKFYYLNGCASARYVVKTYGDRYWTPTQIYARIDEMSLFLFDTWIAPYATGNITAQVIADNLKIKGLQPPVSQNMDSAKQQELDNEIANIINQQQSKASAPPKKRRQRKQQNTVSTQNVLVAWFAAIAQPLENIFKPQGFEIACNESYLRIYKSEWHKARERNIHYQIWGKQFALMCEKPTKENIIQNISAKPDLNKILSAYYSDYRGQYADNRMDLSILSDDAAIIKTIQDVIIATCAKVDACINKLP